MSSRVIGLDLSLTATGIAGFTHDQPWADHLHTPADRIDGHPRLATILATLGEYTASLWVIEGLAYDAHDTNRASAGLSWIVRHALWRRHQPYVVVPPAVLKKYTTGRGDATKQEMLLAADRWFPAAQVADDNEADALWLAHAGRDWLGQPAVRLPAAQRAVLTAARRVKGVSRPAIVWPDLHPLDAAAGDGARASSSSAEVSG